jgi:hypothetical protein
MAITSNAQAIAEINATNLTDGQQIKQLLADLVTYLGAGGTLTPQAGPTELTAVGTASTTALVDVTATPTQAAINNNFASLNTLVNTLMTKLVAAGVLTSV